MNHNIKCNVYNSTAPVNRFQELIDDVFCTCNLIDLVESINSIEFEMDKELLAMFLEHKKVIFKRLDGDIIINLVNK